MVVFVELGWSVAIRIDSLGATAIVSVFLTIIAVIVAVFFVRWSLSEVSLFVPRAPVPIRVGSVSMAPFLTFT